PDVIERTRACSLAWLPDNSGFYYTRYPAAGSIAKGEENYNRHVFFHRLGDDPAKDTEIFGEGRPPEDWPQIRLSPVGRLLVVTEHKGWAMTEVFLKDMKAGNGAFITLVEKVNAVFEPTVLDDSILIRTNHEAPKYKLYRVHTVRPNRADWTELIPEGPDVI